MKKIASKKDPENRQTIEVEDQEKIIRKCNTFMRKIVEKDYLTKYFKNSAKTMDDYFMFRKQFSMYYATNCFLTYILGLTDNTPSNLKLCTKYSRVFHNECKLNYDHSTGMLKGNNEKVPFRLSDNIKEFITDIGLEGIFPNVMTCCSLALRDIKAYLRIFFKEEQMQLNRTSDENINRIVDDVIERIDSIAKPYLDKQYKSQLSLGIFNNFNQN